MVEELVADEMFGTGFSKKEIQHHLDKAYDARDHARQDADDFFDYDDAEEGDDNE